MILDLAYILSAAGSGLMGYLVIKLKGNLGLLLAGLYVSYLTMAIVFLS